MHVVPAAQPTHTPALLQTMFAAHEVPGGWGPVGLHVSVVQLSAPRPQALPGVVHGSFGTHAVQAPL